jgi:hypothetical protein
LLNLIFIIHLYHQLEIKKIKEERIITEFCIKFGLITLKEGDDEDTAVKTQFFHQTFAEYLLAKYLHQGIAINHCEDNQLLDNEPVRDLIRSQILVEDNYDGVRVFIDSTLKETINSEKWRQVTKKQAVLPFRLKNLANSLAHQITAQRGGDVNVRSPPSLHPNPIAVAILLTLSLLLVTREEASQYSVSPHHQSLFPRLYSFCKFSTTFPAQKWNPRRRKSNRT